MPNRETNICFSCWFFQLFLSCIQLSFCCVHLSTVKSFLQSTILKKIQVIVFYFWENNLMLIIVKWMWWEIWQGHKRRTIFIFSFFWVIFFSFFFPSKFFIHGPVSFVFLDLWWFGKIIEILLAHMNFLGFKLILGVFGWHDFYLGSVFFAVSAVIHGHLCYSFAGLILIWIFPSLPKLFIIEFRS